MIPVDAAVNTEPPAVNTAERRLWMLRKLRGSEGGSTSELAALCACEPSDRFFRRVLEEAVQAELFVAVGENRGRRYVRVGPIASGFGAARELGIHRGQARTEAFALMSHRHYSRSD